MVQKYLFSRPQNQQQPTRFLFVGTSRDLDIGSKLSVFSDIECIVNSPSSPYVYFVVFLTEAAAGLAKASLNSRPVEGIKAVKFAQGKPCLQVTDMYQMSISHANMVPVCDHLDIRGDSDPKQVSMRQTFHYHQFVRAGSNS